jgi:hypothetical protein
MLLGHDGYLQRNKMGQKKQDLLLMDSIKLKEKILVKFIHQLFNQRLSES